MANANIPTKVKSRLDILASSENKVCVLCGTSIEKADLRRKLFGSFCEKTKACLNLEIVIGVELERALLLTDIICLRCLDRNATLVNKIVSVRERFQATKTKLMTEACRTIPYTKRMSKENSYDCHLAEPVARKSLFETYRDDEKQPRKTMKTLRYRPKRRLRCAQQAMSPYHLLRYNKYSFMFLNMYSIKVSILKQYV